jgi:conjugative relaxase-like TrwC/TraI family protein
VRVRRGLVARRKGWRPQADGETGRAGRTRRGDGGPRAAGERRPTTEDAGRRGRRGRLAHYARGCGRGASAVPQAHTAGVLTIAKLGAGQESYYLSKVARGIEDYYSGDGEAPGMWMGRCAQRLGLAGEVPGSQLRAGLAGRNPITDEQLAGTPGARRVPGWDLTFCAPKSVSVLYALGDRPTSAAVVDAHEVAVAQALSYLEAHATVSRRRIDGVIHQVVGEGLAIAAFRHRTSRAGDPHLHTHALALNLVERVTGGWGAMHSPMLYRHARTAGFVYQAILRSELTHRLGVGWEPVRNGYAEIAGVDGRLIAAFSKRHAEIASELGDVTDRSAREVEIAQRRTKSPKLGIDGSKLHQRWHDEAEAIGIDPTTLGRAVRNQPGPRTTDEQMTWIMDDMVSAEGLTAHQATFDRRDVVRTWCEELPPGSRVSLNTIEQLTDASPGRPAAHRALDVGGAGGRFGRHHRPGSPALVDRGDARGGTAAHRPRARRAGRRCRAGRCISCSQVPR